MGMSVSTPCHTLAVCNGQPFLPPFNEFVPSSYLVERDCANCSAIRNSQFGAIRISAILWHNIWLCSSFKPMGGYGHALAHIGIGFGGLGEHQGPSGGCLDAGQCPICARSAVRIAVCVRYGGVMVRHGHGIAMEEMALECMQMGVGWGEWASQVEHSSRGEQGCACGNAHPFVCVPQFELRFECDMAV